jgi:hypothetical protein
MSRKGCGIESHYILRHEGDGKGKVIGRMSGGFLGTLVALAPMITAGIHGVTSIVNNAIKAKHGKGKYSLVSKDGKHIDLHKHIHHDGKKYRINKGLKHKHIEHAKGMFGESSIHHKAHMYKKKAPKRKIGVSKGQAMGFGTLGQTGQILYD